MVKRGRKPTAQRFNVRKRVQARGGGQKYKYFGVRFDSKPGYTDLCELISEWGNGCYEFIDNKGKYCGSYSAINEDFRAKMDGFGNPIILSRSGRYVYNVADYVDGYKKGYKDAQKGTKIDSEDTLKDHEISYQVGWKDGYHVGFKKGQKSAVKAFEEEQVEEDEYEEL